MEEKNPKSKHHGYCRRGFSMSDKLLEYRLVRVSRKVEECYVMAKSWEDAERQGHEEEQDWEHCNSEDEIEVDLEESG